MVAPYTRLPRPTLWLLRPDVFDFGGARHEVPALYISKAPLTNEEYEAFDPEHDRGPCSVGGDQPVVGVSLADAEGYCAWYSERSGKAFRLPTEIEWEFACRGGSRERFFWGDDVGAAERYVWDAESSGGRTHAIEELEANSFGLYDILGNVWEWTGSGDECGQVIRGGSFRTPRAAISSELRDAISAETRRDDLGFRIVRLLR